MRGLIDSAKTLLGGIRINYNTQVGPNISELLEVSKQIIPLIEVEDPSIAETLENTISQISYYYCPLNYKRVSPTSLKTEVGLTFCIGQAPSAVFRVFGR